VSLPIQNRQQNRVAADPQSAAKSSLFNPAIHSDAINQS
jgi:hypothetical protein